MNDTETLEYLLHRCKLALARRPAQPFYALQYRLCEVGPSRLHPKELRKAIPLLVRANKLKELKPGIYTLSDSESQSDQKALENTQRICEQIGVLNEGSFFDGMQTTIKTVANAKTLKGSLIQDLRDLYAGMQISSHSVTMRVSPRSRTPVGIWISHDPEMIYPEDYRLWTFLQSCAEQRIHPVIFARAISPATFPLLKAINAKGIQYYRWIVPNDIGNVLKGIDDTGWPSIQTVADFASSTSLKYLDRTVREFHHETLDDDIIGAVLSSQDFTLHESSAGSANNLVDWATSSQTQLPERWLNGITNTASGKFRERTIPDKGPIEKPNQSKEGSDEAVDIHRETTIERVPLVLRDHNPELIKRIKERASSTETLKWTPNK